MLFSVILAGFDNLTIKFTTRFLLPLSFFLFYNLENVQLGQLKLDSIGEKTRKLYFLVVKNVISCFSVSAVLYYSSLSDTF